MAPVNSEKKIPITTSNGVRYISESDIVRIPDGVLGFKDYTDFVFFDIEGCEPFKSMLSVKEGGPDFVVVETQTIIDDYRPFDAIHSLEHVDFDTPFEPVVLSIVTLSENPEDITVNLRAPLVINIAASTGRQIILDDERYVTRFPLYVPA